MSTRVKVCGITTADDALAAAQAGADAIGLVFAAGSPRRLAIDQAAAIRASLPAFVACVALFMDQPADEVTHIIRAVQPDLLQFHGSESEAHCAAFGRPWIKAVGLGGGEAVAPDAYAGANGILLDGHAAGAAGGSGQRFDWGRIAAWQAARPARSPVIVAGGLTPDNVGGLVKQCRPWGVDVSSGVESAPGVKDHAKVHAFIEAVRRVDCAPA